MMTGGGLMMGLGLLIMFLVVSLPILLIGAIIVGVSGLSARRNRPAFSPSATNATAGPAGLFTRYCSNCGQGLGADWIHCPKCGTTI